MVSVDPDSFTGESLAQALKEGLLAHPQALLTGMVKQSDKEGYIAFTQSRCDEWVEIPVNMIQKADLLGHRRCEDHNHPLMQIHIKEPKGPEGKALMALLVQSTSQAIRWSSPLRFRALAAPSGHRYHVRPGSVQRALRRDLGFGDGFGQECFYDCYDACLSVGNTNWFCHAYCEQRCQISMPPQLTGFYWPY